MHTMQSTRRTLRRLSGFVVLAAAVAVAMPVRGADKRIVLIAGKPSHPPGMHEFRAGSLLMQKALAGFPGVTVQVYDGGWPSKMVDGARVDDDAALDGADAVMIYADGGKGNPAIQGNRIKVIDALAAKGVGLGFAHYGVEVPAGEPGEAMHRWIGGYYEDHYSVNPMWAPPFDKLPQHPITRGVGPFATLRRVVLQHALVERSRGAEAGDAHPGRHAERRGAQRARTSARRAPTITSSRPAVRRRR